MTGSSALRPGRARRQAVLNLNLGGAAADPQLWLTGDRPAEYLLTGRFYQDVARIAERGLLNAVFFADVPALWTNPQRSFPQAMEPTVLAARVAGATARIGIVVTLSTTYSNPEELARSLVSLQQVSRGRMGWNAVTTAQSGPMGNFGVDQYPPRSARYLHADEFISFVQRYCADALADLPTPEVYQAGGSSEGIDLAGKHATRVFCSVLAKEFAKQYRENVRHAAARHGRNPDQILVLPGLGVHLGCTDEEARQRYRQSRTSSWAGRLEHFESLLDTDLSRFDPAVPLSEGDYEAITASVERGGSLGFWASLQAAIRENGGRLDRTLEIVGSNHRQVVGSPRTVANLIGDWLGDGAADGFNLSLPNLPHDLEWFVAEVVPLLQADGIYESLTAERPITDDDSG